MGEALAGCWIRVRPGLVSRLGGSNPNSLCSRFILLGIKRGFQAVGHVVGLGFSPEEGGVQNTPSRRWDALGWLGLSQPVYSA